ncbi:tetratricopeptide repeat protein [Buchnera aphidicola (Rhopalosiphum padi)]|uniref:Ancillary SecYEG translocon subunit n=1 Tax=Buchnera aphidicola subsp. Rhopalosiphum padi TaxID=98793 RepID=A0A4D6Y6Q5_BUCRP|nr:tetratricopeptide repeat protein [Buchnera aphidicola]QCI25217.1 tetratricopeptide repeat protein [Buchnera aphidicola (Rhopalosiphum padi)]
MHLNSTKKKSILNKNTYLIVFILTFFILFIFWFSKGKEKKSKLQELKYEEIIKKINANKKEDLSSVEKFIVENKNIYGTLSSLSLAKKYILDNNLDKAFIQLDNSLKYTKEENLKNILKLRIAKIKIQQNKNQDAMKILEDIKDSSWTNIIENMKGDIFMKNKDIKKAILAWEKSKYFEQSNASKEIINMKINQIKK